MPINNAAELAERLEIVNRGIQDITDYLNQQNSNDGLIRFPAGYLRTCAQHRAEYAFIADEHLKSNIAYTLMTLDVVIWINNRTTLTGQAMSMLLKVAIILITSIIESLVRYQQRNIVWPPRQRVTYRTRISRLVTDGVVDDILEQELNWIWDRRQSVHLYQISGGEFMEYNATEVARAMAVCSSLRSALSLPR